MKKLLTLSLLVSSILITNAQINRNLSLGSRGDDVKELQNKLGVEATGYFGNQTKKMVADWQASVGLPSTGYFGPMSIKAWNSTSSISINNSTSSEWTQLSDGSMKNNKTGQVFTLPTQQSTSSVANNNAVNNTTANTNLIDTDWIRLADGSMKNSKTGQVFGLPTQTQVAVQKNPIQNNGPILSQDYNSLNAIQKVQYERALNAMNGTGLYSVPYGATFDQINMINKSADSYYNNLINQLTGQPLINQPQYSQTQSNVNQQLNAQTQAYQAQQYQLQVEMAKEQTRLDKERMCQQAKTNQRNYESSLGSSGGFLSGATKSDRDYYASQVNQYCN